MMSSTKMLYLLRMHGHHTEYHLWQPALRCRGTVLDLPDVPEGQLRQVRQLLHLDDGVVQRRLQTLGHHVR